MEIAFYDFDGTITRKDSFLQFIRFTKGRLAFYGGFLINLPVLIAYKVGIVPNWKAKEVIFSYFFKGISEEEMHEKGQEFARLVIPNILRSEAITEIERHKQSNVKQVVVTASFAIWIKPWCEYNGMELIASEYETEKLYLTGKIKGKNCYGEEKVKRINAQYNLDEYSLIYAYGDSRADQNMLNLADEKWMKWVKVK